MSGEAFSRHGNLSVCDNSNDAPMGALFRVACVVLFYTTNYISYKEEFHRHSSSSDCLSTVEELMTLTAMP